MKKRLFSILTALSLAVPGMAITASADASKVVTLGYDLTDEQKNTMLRYFNISPNQVPIIYITNEDEVSHLGSYISLDIIGNKTYSCAYVKPTQSGGIRVKTANLTWVTGNMIASALSTSGVKNAEVIAACPFQVTGTGALTGVQMAYEQATGEKLSESKKELATQEIVVCGELGEHLGQDKATEIINQTKIEVIENNVTNITEINNIITNVVIENNVELTEAEMEDLNDFIVGVANESYDFDDVKDTLLSIDETLEVKEKISGAGYEDLEEYEPYDLHEYGDGSMDDPYEIVDEDSEEILLDAVDDSILEGAIVTSTEDILPDEEIEEPDEDLDAGTDSEFDGWEEFTYSDGDYDEMIDLDDAEIEEIGDEDFTIDEMDEMEDDDFIDETDDAEDGNLYDTIDLSELSQYDTSAMAEEDQAYFEKNRIFFDYMILGDLSAVDTSTWQYGEPFENLLGDDNLILYNHIMDYVYELCSSWKNEEMIAALETNTKDELVTNKLTELLNDSHYQLDDGQIAEMANMLGQYLAE